MTKKTITITAIVIVLVVLGWCIVLLIQERGVPVSGGVATPQEEQKVEWRTYSNDKYGFSIQYPCGASCQANPPTPYKNVYAEGEIGIPTSGAINISITMFTSSDAKDWNDNLAGGANLPFLFNLMSAKDALKGEVGSKCEITTTEVTIPALECTVVLLAGERALRFITTQS